MTQDHFLEQGLLGFVPKPCKKAIDPLLIVLSNQLKIEEKLIFRTLLWGNETAFQQRIVETTTECFVISICVEEMCTAIRICD
ncbi:hypothetical protein BA763_23305 [Burkholderia cenocepacia]|nr:hypothetical protein BA763_23305 [Burkholderia cenocepacia]